jgi:PadR family transcriptional regulator, regulatory protein PadR
MLNLMTVDRELLKGSVTLLILKLLSRGDMYGYEIIQEASRRSDNTFQFKEGTLYPALHQLQRKGYLRSEWRTADNGRQRKYYALTNRGRALAEQSHARWMFFTSAVNAVLSGR